MNATRPSRKEKKPVVRRGTPNSAHLAVLALCGAVLFGSALLTPARARPSAGPPGASPAARYVRVPQRDRHPLSGMRPNPIHDRRDARQSGGELEIPPAGPFDPGFHPYAVRLPGGSPDFAPSLQALELLGEGPEQGTAGVGTPFRVELGGDPGFDPSLSAPSLLGWVGETPKMDARLPGFGLLRKESRILAAGAVFFVFSVSLGVLQTGGQHEEALRSRQKASPGNPQ